jgi:hypothetical protein
MRLLLLAIVLVGYCSRGDLLITNYPGHATGYVIPSIGLLDLGYAVRIVPDDVDAIPDEALPVGALTVTVSSSAIAGLGLYIAENASGLVDGNPADVPGAVVGTFIDAASTPPGGTWNGTISLDPISPFVLDEGTSYWLVARGTGVSFVNWVAADGSDPHGRIFNTLAIEFGDTYSAAVTGTPVFGLAFVPVPEPGSFALLGLAGLALTAWRRRTA